MKKLSTRCYLPDMRSLKVATGSLIAISLLAGLTTALSPAKAGSDTKIKVATYNVCRPATCEDTGGVWKKRKEKLLNTILASNAPLIAMQELDDYDGNAALMAKDLQPHGYVKAPTGSDRCRPVACSNHIFYKPDVFKYLPQGGPGSVQAATFTSPDLYDQDVKDRPLGYVLLEHIPTGRQVFAISVKFPPQRKSDPVVNEKSNKVREAMTKKLPGWMEQHLAEVGADQPVQIILGDVNTFVAKGKKTPQKKWPKMGWLNTEKVSKKKKRININVGTVNRSSNSKDKSGFPSKPIYYDNVDKAPRIDIIFTKDTAQSTKYEVMLKLRKDGKFQSKYQASDHNLVEAVIPIKPLVAAS
jgi:hypothetical protein